MTKPIAIDLFCGGGGAALGLMWAGYEVIGIDIELQKNYPGHFILGDALNPPIDLKKAAIVWASPPCQRFSIAGRSRGNDYLRHPDHTDKVRELLAGHPYTVIENVAQAPIRQDLILTGEMFGLRQLRRRRAFELSFFAWQLPYIKLQKNTYITVTTSMCSNSHFYRRKAEGKKGKPHPMETKHAMGISRSVSR